MPTAPFHFQELFELGPDDTEYRLLTAEHVSVQSFNGRDVLCVDPQALTLLCSQAFHDINFFLRPKHLKQVAAILEDPEASDNDRMVALTMLKNADVSSAGCFHSARTPAPRSSWAKRDTPSGRAAMRRHSLTASTTPTPRTICDTRRTPRSTCGMRRTRTRISRRRSTSRPSTATNTSCCLSPKGAGRPTNRFCFKRRERFSIQSRWSSI